MHSLADGYALDTMTDGPQLIAFGFSFSICWGTSVGLGRHQVDVKPEWRSSLKKSEYAFSVLYVWIFMGYQARR